MHHLRLHGLFTLAGVLLIASPAEASDPVAERLYNEGRAAAQAKDWNRACALLQESQNREPAPGTLLNLADCEENRGKLVRAAAQYQAAARLFRQGDPRVKYAKDHAAALDKRIATLRIRFEGEGTVECDGEPLEVQALAAPIAMDPGNHELVVRASGRAPSKSTLHLDEGEAREIQLTSGPPLTAAASPLPSSPEPHEGHVDHGFRAPKANAARDATSPPKASGAEPSRVPAYAALGVGGLGLGLGAVTGVLGLNEASRVGELCPGRVCPSQVEATAADDAASRARTMAVVSTIGFGVGIAAGAAGAYLLLRPSSKIAVAPALGQGSTGFVVEGRL